MLRQGVRTVLDMPPKKKLNDIQQRQVAGPRLVR